MDKKQLLANQIKTDIKLWFDEYDDNYESSSYIIFEKVLKYLEMGDDEI